MNRDEYYAAIEAYKQNRVEHGEWKKHKYIRIENGRYIYPGDLKKDSDSTAADKSNNRAHFNAASSAAGSKDRVKLDENGSLTSQSEKVVKKLGDTARAVQHPGQVAPTQAKPNQQDENGSEVKSEYHKLAEESGLSDKDVDDIIASARYNYDNRYNAALKGAEQSAKKLGSGYKVKVEPHGDMLDFNIYDQSGNKVSKDISIDNLDSDIKLQIKKGKDSVYLKSGKKVQHSDPRAAFYAAVDEYKLKKGLKPAGPILKHSSNSRDAYFSAIQDYKDAHLEHHGILGMKWGVRRYQNPDGTLTSAGKKRYSEGDLQEIKKASSRFGIVGGLIKTHQINKRNAKAEKEASEKKATEDKKDTATLGLKALQKMGRDIGVDDIDEGSREWFLYEDQTIGLPQVANLVAQGKTKQQIMDIAKEAGDKVANGDDDDDTWSLANLGGTKELPQFIDACQEVMKDKNWKDSKVDRSNTANSPKIKAVVTDQVSKPKSESTTRKSGISDAQKNTYMSNAKKGKFDINFLEVVQNEPWANSRGKEYDEKRVLNEYSKYLDDPEDYWRYRDH